MSYLIPKDVTDPKTVKPIGYAALVKDLESTELQVLRLKAAIAEADKNVKFCCPSCKKRTAIRNLRLTQYYKYWRSWNSYEDSTEEHVYNTIICDWCTWESPILLTHPLSSRISSFGRVDRCVVGRND